MKRGINWKVLIICLIVVYAIAFAGSLFTNIDSGWYDSVKPSITPPNYVFPIVWNILFFMIALSLYFAWISANKKQKKEVASVFAINLFLNLLWSFFFFKLQRPSLAFAELVVLEASILAMILTTQKVNKESSYLLIPYLLWVTFAGVLNYLIAY